MGLLTGLSYLHIKNEKAVFYYLDVRILRTTIIESRLILYQFLVTVQPCIFLLAICGQEA